VLGGDSSRAQAARADQVGRDLLARVKKGEEGLQGRVPGRVRGGVCSTHRKWGWRAERTPSSVIARESRVREKRP